MTRQNGFRIRGQQSWIAGVVDGQVTFFAPRIGVAQGLFTAHQFLFVPTTFANARNTIITTSLDVNRNGTFVSQSEFMQQTSIDDHEVASLCCQCFGSRDQRRMHNGIQRGGRFSRSKSLRSKLATINIAITRQDVFAKSMHQIALKSWMFDQLMTEAIHIDQRPAERTELARQRAFTSTWFTGNTDAHTLF